MKDERECPHCKEVIDCSRAGYRTLNGHKTSCKLNPKFEDRNIKRSNSFRATCADKLRYTRVLSCLQCDKDYDIFVSQKQFELGNYNKHCSRKCANKTSGEKGMTKKKKSLSKAYSNGLLTGLRPMPKGIKQKRTPARLAGYSISRKKRVKINCLHCKIEFEVIVSRVNKTKFCSGTCRNKVNNKIIRGTRSKAEVELENRLKQLFPRYSVICNDREILSGLELDLYIPELNLGIEWNGIWHYVDVRKNGDLQKRQDSDRRKLLKAKEVGVSLLVIKDMSNSKKNQMKLIDETIKTIKEEYASFA